VLLVLSCVTHLCVCDYYAVYDGRSNLIGGPSEVIAVAVIDEVPSSSIDIPSVRHRLWDSAEHSTSLISSPSRVSQSPVDQRIPSASTGHLKASQSRGIVNAAVISSHRDLKMAGGGKKKKKKKKKSSKKKKKSSKKS
jgi:hypothetical protein